ncbi:MAG: transporter substrate-binding domain-containing protein, partial [Campylobacterota bacterium]|nr:transporter substrate-binding domain-containing protein [Campylobacterota bacterium]
MIQMILTLLLKQLQEEYAMAVSKDNEKLLKEIDDALTELRKNGEYDSLFEKYFS